MKQADVLERMDRYLAQWREADDARHVSLSCYRMMTARMLLAIDERACQDRAIFRKHGARANDRSPRARRSKTRLVGGSDPL